MCVAVHAFFQVGGCGVRQQECLHVFLQVGSWGCAEAGRNEIINTGQENGECEYVIRVCDVV